MTRTRSWLSTLLTVVYVGAVLWLVRPRPPVLWRRVTVALQWAAYWAGRAGLWAERHYWQAVA